MNHPSDIWSNSPPYMVFHVRNDGIVVDCMIPDDSKLTNALKNIVNHKFSEILPKTIEHKVFTFLKIAKETNSIQRFQYDLGIKPIRYHEAIIVPNGKEEVLFIVHELGRSPEIPLSPTGDSVLQPSIEDIIRRLTLHINELESINRSLILENEHYRENERKLIQAQSIHRALLDNLPDPMWLKNAEGQFIGANTPFAKMVGAAEPERLVGKSAYDVLPKGRADEFVADDRRVLQTKRAVLHEMLRVDESGNEVWYEFTKHPIFNDRNEAIGTLGIARNIDERKRSQEILLTSKSELEELAQQRTYELRKAYEDLLASEVRYRAIIQDQSDMICRIAPDGTLTFANGKFCSFYNRPLTELFGLNLSDLIGVEHYNLYRDKLTSLTAQNPTATYTYESTSQSGSFSTTTWIIHGLYDDQNQLIEVQSVGHDTTEQRYADRVHSALLEIIKSYATAPNLEEMLSVFHAQLSKLMDATNFFVALYHPDLESYSFPYYVDPYDESILANAYHPLPHTLTDYVRRTGKPMLCDHNKFQEFKTTGEIDILGKESNCWLGVPLQTQRGVIGVAVVQTYSPGKEYSQSDLELLRFVASNIAAAIELKSVEEERKRLAAAIESASESIVLLDSAEIIRYVNPAFQEITGYSYAEAVNRSRVDLLKPNEDNPERNEEISKAYRNGETWRGEQTFRTKNGALIYMETALSPIKDETGKIVNYVKVERDITREKLLEDQLRQSQKLEAIGQLAGGIAHDFNNLLTAIIGNISLAKIGTYDQVQSCLDDAERASARASGLVKQILSFSRRSDIQLQLTDLEVLLDEISNMVRNTIDRKIEIEVDTKHLTCKVLADAVQLHQVLLNLCVNARDAMMALPEELSPSRIPLLRICAEDFISTPHYVQSRPDAAIGKYVKVSVIDNGTGMAPETQKRIFEPFFTTKPSGKGTGLGLATVYGIVKQHDGWLDVVSELGKGTTFSFFLPVAEGATLEASEVAAVRPAFGNETILIVDDEEMIRTLSRSVLEQLGYKVLIAENGIEAIKIYSTDFSLIDLVILDYSMPKMSGGEVLQEMLAINPKVKVIISSGYDTIGLRGNTDVAGAMNFISKPFQIGELARAIRDTLDT